MDVQDKINHLCKSFHRKLSIELQSKIYNDLLNSNGYITPPNSPITKKIPNAPIKRKREFMRIINQ